MRGRGWWTGWRGSVSVGVRGVREKGREWENCEKRGIGFWKVRHLF